VFNCCQGIPWIFHDSAQLTDVSICLYINNVAATPRCFPTYTTSS
jgi:hypothetical protein